MPEGSKIVRIHFGLEFKFEKNWSSSSKQLMFNSSLTGTYIGLWFDTGTLSVYIRTWNDK